MSKTYEVRHPRLHPRDCWLQGAVHDEGRGCEASFKGIASADAGKLGVVINVTLCGRGIATRPFSRAPAVTEEAKGWLARLLRL